MLSYIHRDFHICSHYWLIFSDNLFAFPGQKFSRGEPGSTQFASKTDSEGIHAYYIKIALLSITSI